MVRVPRVFTAAAFTAYAVSASAQGALPTTDYYLAYVSTTGRNEAWFGAASSWSC